jgi:large conductance mechanosensitive channel
MRKMLAEFKAFAFRGNMIDLAVAVILGLAFAAVITALVDHVLMPIITAIFGQPNFSSLVLDIGDGEIRYGIFLNALVSFLLIALALFFVIRAVNRMMHPRGAPGRARRDPRVSLLLHADRDPGHTLQRLHQPGRTRGLTGRVGVEVSYKHLNSHSAVR